ncbi:hypothetical protein OESDEN_09829 [Oesophagostomum dentatum]|uniref:EamA domain-containing protein n=1 Tax=Oesophagostomum dentatum TaxID=61180 RepID=A0A0B1T4J5_OESDE|nr:hypothetical protein OESDEN_09829 [Oesophagostomum dentatum]
MYLFVKNTSQELVDVDKMEKLEEKSCSVDLDSEDIRVVSTIERALCFLSAMCCGLAYGTMWVPVDYIMSRAEQFHDAPKESISYLFSFYCGVMSVSTVIFTVYCIVRRNNPWVNPESVIPSMVSGAVLAAAMSAFVISVDLLDQAIAYPICAMMPGLVASIWSVFYYKEITDRKNLTLLALAYGFTLFGVGLISVSRENSLF